MPPPFLTDTREHDSRLQPVPECRRRFTEGGQPAVVHEFEKQGVISASLTKNGEILPPVRCSLPERVTVLGIPVENMEMGGLRGKSPGRFQVVRQGSELVGLPVHPDVCPADKA